MIKNSVTIPESFVESLMRDAIAIDCGITMTKIIVVNSAAHKPKSLEYVSVRNSELKVALDEIHNTINTMNLSQILITGFKSVWAKTIVKTIFHLEATLVNEISAISKGFELLTKHSNIKDIEYSTEDIGDIYKIDDNNPLVQKMKQAMLVNREDTAIVDKTKFNLPAILVDAGSFVKFYFVKAHQSIELINATSFGGETLRGLSKAILDFNDYDNIVTLASKGSRENVDTQAFEIFSEDEKSPYGKFPPKMPLFSFGKCANRNKGIEDFAQEDLMTSLCHMVFSDVLMIVLQLSKAYKIRSVYFFGAMFSDSTFVKFLQARQNILSGNLNLHIIKCEYISAIGALKVE